SVFNGLFLRPLPFAESDRLIELDETAPKWNLKYVGVSNPDSYEWRKNSLTFDCMSFFSRMSYNLSAGGAAQRVEAAQVTRDMLDVLRLKPLIGRDFRPEEDKPGGAKVVLLNYDLWQRMFEGDRNVLGRVVKLDEQPYTVIGVLPHAVWSKTSCCLPVVVLQEAAQSLLAAHVAIAATHPLLSRWKKQNIFL